MITVVLAVITALLVLKIKSRSNRLFCEDFKLLDGASMSTHLHTMLILNAARLSTFAQH